MSFWFSSRSSSVSKHEWCALFYCLLLYPGALLFHGGISARRGEKIFWAENNFVTQKTRDEFRISAGQPLMMTHTAEESGSRWIISGLLFFGANIFLWMFWFWKSLGSVCTRKMMFSKKKWRKKHCYEVSLIPVYFTTVMFHFSCIIRKEKAKRGKTKI